MAKETKQAYKSISLTRNVWSLDGQVCYIEGQAYTVSLTGWTVRIGSEEEHIEEHPTKLPKGGKGK